MQHIVNFTVFVVLTRFLYFCCSIVTEECALYIPYFTSYLHKERMLVLKRNVVNHISNITYWMLAYSLLLKSATRNLLLFDVKITVQRFL